MNGEQETRPVAVVTRSVFDRYAIVAQSDIMDAMAKLEAKKAADLENSQSSAKVEHSEAQKSGQQVVVN